MKNLAKVILGVGVVVLVISIVSKLINAPVLETKPVTIIHFANACFLLAIALLLAEEKK